MSSNHKSHSRSKSRRKSVDFALNPQVLEARLQALEGKLHKEFTGKLTSTVDKLGQLIKKQEYKIHKLQKAFREFLKLDLQDAYAAKTRKSLDRVLSTHKSSRSQRKSSVSFHDKSLERQSKPNRYQVTAIRFPSKDPQKKTVSIQRHRTPIAASKPFVPAPAPQTFQPLKQANRLSREKAPKRLTSNLHQRKASMGSTHDQYRSLSYKAFSPVLSGTSMSVKHLMQNIKQDTNAIDQCIIDSHKIYNETMKTSKNGGSQMNSGPNILSPTIGIGRGLNDNDYQY